MEHRVVFRGKGEVEVEPFEIGSPEEGQAKLRTLVSLMSTGTEGICLHRRFAPGTHWDNWVKYPFYSGYCAVSVVEEDAEGFPAGTRVVSRTGHASAALVPVSRLYRVPEGMAPEDASWFALAKIALVGAKAAGYGLGTPVLVIGAGPIGQMSVRWAAAAGAGPVVVLDPVAARGEFALRGGADRALEIPVAGAKEAVTEAFGGRLPDVVIDTTGHAAVFAAATELVADKGRLVVLGDTGSPSEQCLTKEVINRGLTIAGAHDRQLPEIQESYAPFFHLAQKGRFPLDGLITHTFRGTEAPAAFELATDRRDETMGILFDWR
ncbi:hypothetical protein BH11ARM2_BH11ARM2_10380 [soil metagenome]